MVFVHAVMFTLTTTWCIIHAHTHTPGEYMKTQEFNKHDAVLLMMHLSRIEGFMHAVSDLNEYEHIQKDLSEANHLCLKLISKTSKEYANRELLTAVEETIEDNLDLADGEDCTLIKLKKALEHYNK